MPHPESSRIDRIIDIARGVAPVGPGERENREATRIPYASSVALVLIHPSGKKGLPIILPGVNISSGGVCVITSVELPVGGRGAILMQKSNAECVLLGARVIYVNPLSPKSFECGLEFGIQPSSVSLDDFCDATGELPQVGPARAA
ncbi:MAG: PilZ domain-containing protein [Planctomycetota bacterium]